MVGQSSGANLVGALQVARRLERGTVVTIFCDFGVRYLSTNLWIGWGDDARSEQAARMRLDDEQIERYSRQLILAEVGPRGQERLGAARVAVVGDGRRGGSRRRVPRRRGRRMDRGGRAAARRGRSRRTLS